MFILTALSTYPCTDGGSCADEKKTGKTVTVSEHEHSPNEIDLCSPFCVCSCCSTQVSQPNYFFYTAFSPMYSDFNSKVRSHSVKSIYFSIWQPPKLG